MLIVMHSMNKELGKTINLSACQLVNSLSMQELTSTKPLSMRLYIACQLVSSKLKTGKSRAPIHTLGSLSDPLSIYAYTDKVVSVYMCYIIFYGICEAKK